MKVYIVTLPSIVKRDVEGEIYRQYITEGIKMLTENTARYGGTYMQISYNDFIHPKPADNRTSEEIIEHVKRKVNEVGGEA